MSKRYPGGLITKTPVVPTTSAASGVWTLDQAITYIQAGTWPIPQPPGGPFFIGWLGGTTYVDGRGIGIDSSNNLYIAASAVVGTTQCLLVAKFNSSGVVQWQQTLGSIGTACYGWGAAVDASGNVYVAGQSPVSGGSYEIVKYNTSGSIQWQRSLSGSNGAAYAIAVDSSSNVYITGTMNAGSTNNISLAKYNSSGTIQWQQSLGNSSYTDYGYGIAVDSSGNVYITGFSATAIGGYYLVTLKYNSSGTLQWQRQIGNGSFVYSGNAIAVDSSGNIYVTGYTYDTPGTNSSILTVKYDTSGAIQWQRRLGSSNTDYGYGIAVDSSGNCYIVGQNGAGLYCEIAKYNTSGAIQWQRRLSGSSSDLGRGVTVDSLGNIYIVGYTGANGTNGNAMIAKLPSNGSLTGTYTVGGYSFTYAASTLTDTTTTYNENAGGLTNPGTTLTDAATSITDTSRSLTSSVTTL